MKDTAKLSDEELVTMVRTADQELFSEVVKRYQDKLTRYAAYLVGDHEKAVEVVQESFIKAFINLQGFNVNKKFSSWIYRIVHNEAINYAKKHSRSISLEQNKWIQDTVPSRENVERDVNLEEIRTQLRDTLARLPLKYREPLALFYLEEQSYEEISDVLRLPAGTVGTRLNRGKKLLKELYQQQGGEPHV